MDRPANFYLETRCPIFRGKMANEFFEQPDSVRGDIICAMEDFAEQESKSFAQWLALQNNPTGTMTQLWDKYQKETKY